MKKKRPELVEIGIESLTEEGNHGTFHVTVYNGTDGDVKHTIGVESNFPLIFVHDNKVLNKNGNPSTFVETRVVTIPPAAARKYLFHWRDLNKELKGISMRAMFMGKKTDEISFI